MATSYRHKIIDINKLDIYTTPEDYSMTRYRKAEETIGDHVSQITGAYVGCIGLGN